MKTPRIVNAIGHIDDELISGATNFTKVAKNKLWLKWGSIAACFAVMLMAVMAVAPMMFNDDPVPPIGDEYVYEKGYFYNVDEGVFSTYVGGKIGDKMADVAVTAGWKNEAGEWISTENLNAEVYAIDGISADVAVALKFIDQGEAVTTTHYYVIMNPNADLTAVEDYIIIPIVPNNPGNEMAGEVNE